MKKGTLIFFSIFLLGMLVTIATSQVFDDGILDLCVENCEIQFNQALEQCSEIHDNAIHECNEERKNAFSECKELHALNKIPCMLEAIGESQQCKKNANSAEEECISNAELEREQCLSSCNLDGDNDGIPDREDNCPHISNPGQEDFDNNDIGDICQQVLCCSGESLRNECFFSTIDSCRANNGAVMDCNLPEEIIGDVVPSELKNFTLTRANETDSALSNLTRDVKSTGVNNSNYTLGGYDCRSFASDLEKNLTTLGYNATWTAYWCYGGVGNPPPTAHAVTDVHLSDGRTVFVEPQNNRIINLDFDGDGVVEVNNNGYVPGQNTGQTDDNCKISVFDNRAAAAAAGVPGA